MTMSFAKPVQPDIDSNKGQGEFGKRKKIKIGDDTLFVPQDIFLQFRHFKVQVRARTDAEALSKLLELKLSRTKHMQVDVDQVKLVYFGSNSPELPQTGVSWGSTSGSCSETSETGSSTETASELGDDQTSNTKEVPQTIVSRGSTSKSGSETGENDSSTETASEVDDGQTSNTKENHQPNISLESTSTETVYNITLDSSCWLFADKNTTDSGGENSSTFLNPENARCLSYDPSIAIKEEVDDPGTLAIKEEPKDIYPFETQLETGHQDSSGPPSEEENLTWSSDEDDEGYWRDPKKKGKCKQDDPDFDPNDDPTSARKLKENTDYSSDDTVDLADDSDSEDIGHLGNWIIKCKSTPKRRDRQCVASQVDDDPDNAAQTVEHDTEVNSLNICRQKNIGETSEIVANIHSKNISSENETSEKAKTAKDTASLENSGSLDSENLDSENLDKTTNSIHQSEDEPSLCIVCGDDFKNEKEFIEHTKIKHSDVDHICPYCTRWFPGQHRYAIHVNKCGLEKQCSTCDVKLPDKATLLEHIESEHIDLRFKCIKCEHRFRTRGMAYAHVKRNHMRGKKNTQGKINDNSGVTSVYKYSRSLYNCPLCLYKSDIRYALVLHIWKRHKDKEKLPKRFKQFICTFCGLEVDRKCNLRVHMQIHSNERPFVCDICNKSFKTRHRLREHKKLHSSDKEYMCNHCGRLFKRKSYLIQHERIHTGIAGYTCDKCGKGFAQKNSLNYHMSKHHLDLDDEKISEHVTELSKGKKRRNSSDDAKSKNSKTKRICKLGEIKTYYIYNNVCMCQNR